MTRILANSRETALRRYGEVVGIGAFNGEELILCAAIQSNYPRGRGTIRRDWIVELRW